MSPSTRGGSSPTSASFWQDQGSFGGVNNQYVGYLWPMLPFYWLCDLVQLPVWLAERLWFSLIVSVAFWGALRLAERLRVGNGTSRLLAATAYALWPLFTTVIGSTSAAALPGALLPWVLLPLTNERYTARVAALRSALLVPFMGGVNAASTLASLLPVGLYLLSRPPGPRRWKLIAWWAPAVAVATAWWWIPLLLLGVYGENFLPYVETAQTTTDTMAATEALRGAGNWVGYLHFGEAWLPAGWTVASSVLVIVCSALAAGLGLAGLARRDLPERRWLVLTVLVTVLVLLAGYGGAFGGPFHSVVQGWLDGWLSPFRNIYKFQTGLALALVLGLAHLVAVAARSRTADTASGAGRRVRGRRLTPLVAAVLILPGLAWPYLNGSILNPGSFQEIPKYWQATADWLEENSPDSRALVVPATAHGIHTWGSTIDQPLDVVADSLWAQRDYVPFGTPGNRRAMDAVEQALLTGAEVPGLADYLSRRGRLLRRRPQRPRPRPDRAGADHHGQAHAGAVRVRAGHRARSGVDRRSDRERHPAPGRGAVPAAAGGGDLPSDRGGRPASGAGLAGPDRRHRRGLRRPGGAAAAGRRAARPADGADR
ncbi:hypothetical protein SHIRM173S_05642 [Streptomyces hirsutus]